MTSHFSSVLEGPPIEVYAVNKECMDDLFPQKVNLSIGAYRTDEGKTWVLPIVRKVEKLIADDDTLNHEYLPVLGLDSFSSAATRMLLGAGNKAINEGRAIGIQSLSGTGSLRIGASFLHSQLKYSTVFISDPSWENHAMLFQHTGFKNIHQYAYWDSNKKEINFEKLCDDLKNAPEKSVIVLHACAHNPTGSDPNHEQWKEIAKIIKEKNHFPFFDSAYQGFASGDLEKDSWAVRLFADSGLELFCAQSFAKNFGLYGERVGNLTCVFNTTTNITAIKSQFTLIIRGIYSNPPSYGARIVSKVLNNEEYFQEWKECIKIMSQRIKLMREGLREKLEKKGTPGSWKHITDQIGMFSYTGLTEKQVMYIRGAFHVYALKSGRINMCGLNSNNLDYVADAIFNAVTNCT